MNTDDNNNISEIDNEETVVNDVFMEDVFKDNCVDLYKLESLTTKDQSKVFSRILTNLYTNYDDIDFNQIRNFSLQVLKLSCDPDDEQLKFTHKLIVSKEGNKLYFEFENDKKKRLLILLILLGLFLAAAIAATFFGLRYLSMAHLNIDIDGDGIADLNIDKSGNEKAEINISNDYKKPDVNIDFQGNRIAIFNVDTNEDGKADKNFINQDNNNDGVCDLNCDTNDDGWPDINIDLDGDGKADLNIDTNGDGKADLNFDTNKDGKCDLHCDTNGDSVCDDNCVANFEIIKSDTGSSAIIGDGKADVESAEFVVNFIDSEKILVKDLFPEDQKGNFTKYVTKKFTLENRTIAYIRYRVKMVVEKNEYTSDNFVYNIVSTNGGINKDFTTVPKETSFITEHVVIPPLSKQEYEITFKINGINAKQNFDQNRKFTGYLQIDDDVDVVE